jgi:hypothetical protein
MPQVSVQRGEAFRKKSVGLSIFAFRSTRRQGQIRLTVTMDTARRFRPDGSSTALGDGDREPGQPPATAGALGREPSRGGVLADLRLRVTERVSAWHLARASPDHRAP